MSLLFQIFYKLYQMKRFNVIAALMLLLIIVQSCKKYEEIRPSNYSDQLIYMPAAVEGNSLNGIYRINAVANQGQVYRYVADVTSSKLNIPLSVFRSGINNNGNITVTSSVNTDTISKLIVANKFPTVTELLPADKYTLVPTVTIADGESYKNFNVAVDLNFLLANLTKKYAIGIAVSSSEKAKGLYATTILYIDPAFLVPVANFTSSVSAKIASFSNTSTNSNNWSWDYGDGTPMSTDKASPHTYVNAGSYTVKLVTKGALGDFNKSTFSAVVVIP